jgi:hypothetical protein
MPSLSYSLLAVLSVAAVAVVQGETECFADNEDLNNFFGQAPDDTCCQSHVCGIPCPEEVSEPSNGTLLW